MLFPAVSRLREISADVAAAVIATAHGAPVQAAPDPNLVVRVHDHMWRPMYQEYR